jgi:N-acyl-D-aspartate/D-glutamate deacylase
MLQHPLCVPTFSDSGAHVSQIADASLQTHLLGYWVRERGLLTLEQAIRKMTFDLACFWGRSGLAGRGLLREGWLADVVVFDPETVAPQMPAVEHDLPGGARRLEQKAAGILATVVNGEPVLRENRHTGALPGRLLRSAPVR